MPPRRAPARAASEKPAEPTVNGDVKKLANGRGRPKKDATAVTNGVTAPAKKSAGKNEKVDAPAKTIKKRKKVDDSDEEAEPVPKPEPKKARTKAAPKVEKEIKPKPKGPLRRGGKKTEINAIRYTEPLKVFVFGEGGNGELGLGAFAKAKDVKRPRFNEQLTNLNVVRIATGGMHVVALTKDNKILTWGVNDNGALGRDTSQATVTLKDMGDAGSDSDSDDDPTGGLNEAEANPRPVSAEYFPEDTVFVDVVAGDSCSFALTTEGAVYGWGTFRKNEGVLGFTRTIDTARTPIYIDSLKKVTDLACGTNHVLALDTNQHVWAWGNGQQNQLGRRVTERTLIESLVPNRVGFHDSSVSRPSQKITKIACGDYHGIAIATDDHVWAWGANNYAETGYPDNAGDDNANVSAPQIVHSLEGRQVTSVACGSHHNVATTASGELLAWGRCDGFQTGVPMADLDAINDESRLLKGGANKPKILIEPTAIPALSNIVFAASGPEHTIAIDKDGKAYSWGFSANYQTGQGTYDDIELPTRIENTAVKDTKLTWAGAGGQYSILASLKES
ncbi:regulator of chromosome condensation 1/beta-lactamase-inhibitor protein II [Dendryphion nanum]|uniref:Regulator of chromosome condensation 1/beta-lactamase-inhibitor protein II n=1 Tax=Dendryphion nanum TaxID=256645 RepID=A0A9P9EKS0_9PLEO|nr:regulator of chromosome condensation 1/beta-lactamase-inhibitor protein II [Dendryphion nanum]